MRITNLFPLPESEKVDSKNSSESYDLAENIRFSEDAAEVTVDNLRIQNLETQLASLPDVRRERIQQLQQAVQNGTYQVSNTQIAEAVLTDWSEAVQGKE